MCCEPVLRSRTLFDPSPDATSSHLNLDPVPASVGLARSFVSEALTDFDEDDREVALLLTSELVTNAILHARTPVEVGMLRDRDRLLVCVADRMGDSEELVPRDHSHTRPGGRGLALVADLSATWGTETHTGGKTVWFVLQGDQQEVRAG